MYFIALNIQKPPRKLGHCVSEARSGHYHTIAAAGLTCMLQSAPPQEINR